MAFCGLRVEGRVNPAQYRNRENAKMSALAPNQNVGPGTQLLHDVVPDSDATGIRAVNKCANVYVAPIHPRNRVANG
jgi:hypothetical protein